MASIRSGPAAAGATVGLACASLVPLMDEVRETWCEGALSDSAMPAMDAIAGRNSRPRCANCSDLGVPRMRPANAAMPGEHLITLRSSDKEGAGPAFRGARPQCERLCLAARRFSSTWILSSVRSFPAEIRWCFHPFGTVIYDDLFMKYSLMFNLVNVTLVTITL